MKTKIILATIACLACFTVAVSNATPQAEAQVTLLEFYVNGEKVATYVNSLQTVSLVLPKSGKTNIRIYTILERDGVEEIPIVASTTIANPIYSCRSDTGNTGTQNGSQWTTVIKSGRLIVDLSGRVDCSRTQIGDVIYQISTGVTTLLVVNAAPEEEHPSNPLVSAIRDLVAGDSSVLFYPSVFGLVAITLVIRKRLRPKEIRNR